MPYPFSVAIEQLNGLQCHKQGLKPCLDWEPSDYAHPIQVSLLAMVPSPKEVLPSVNLSSTVESGKMPDSLQYSDALPRVELPIPRRALWPSSPQIHKINKFATA